MRVAITATGRDPDCQVDTRFGRAEHILVVDTNTGLWESRDHSSAVQVASGAGVQAAKSVVDLGVRALITGNIGPNAFQMLQARGVEVFEAVGDSVQHTLRAFEAGKLQPIMQPHQHGSRSP